MSGATMSKYKRRADDPPTHEEDPILGICEVARQIGKSHTTIGKWCADGLLKAIRMPSGMLGIRKSEVNKFLGSSALDVQVKEPNDG